MADDIRGLLAKYAGRLSVAEAVGTLVIAAVETIVRDDDEEATDAE